MSSLIKQLRALLHRIFFWHDGGKRSSEFVPEPAHDHALVLQVTSTPPVPRWRQLRYVARVLNIRERRTLLAMILLFIAAVGLAGWFVARSWVITVPTTGGRMIEAIIGAPKYPHPFYDMTNDPDQDLVALVYSGLFRRMDGSTVVPDLVERFSWSGDGKVLTLTLRNDARFHDGTSVTPDDVVFTLNAAKDPSWKSSYVNSLQNVSVERVDDHTVTLTLERPDTNILDVLTIGILPAHVWQEIPPGSAHLADANIRPIGSGPFRVRSFLQDAHGEILAYTLERNDRYYGMKPLLDQLELRFYPDRSQAEEALRGGQVDALAFVPGQSVADLTKHERLAASTLELPQETIAFFNVNDATLKDPKVRQALALVVERGDVVDAQAGIASPVNGPFPFVAYQAATSTSEERLEQARKLLDDAGWVTPTDGDIRVKKPVVKIVTPPKTSGKTPSKTPVTAPTSTPPVVTASSTPFALTITVPDVPDLIAVADVLKRRWSLLGVKVEVAVEQAESLARRITSDRNAQILVWNILLSPSQDQRPVWWSGEATGRGLNLSNLADRTVDDALDAIRAATTTQMLEQTRSAFAQAVLARAPAAFLTRPGYGYVHNVRVQGMAKNLQLGKPSDRFNDAVSWYVKTGWRWR